MPDADGRYRVLSLDGGGSWVLLEVLALRSIYGDTITGNQLLAQFDLIAANSGGSIVAAALASDRTLPEILRLVADPETNCRKQIFHSLPFYDEVPRVVGIGPQYSTKEKLMGLTGVLNSGPKQVADIPLAKLPSHLDIETQFLITAFDYNLQRARFFRSDTYSKAGSFTPSDTKTTLVEAAHASSTPPVQFFDEPARSNCGQFWDGAVGGYNNPVLAAVLELLAKGVSRHKILVLTLGSGNVSLPPATSGPAADFSLVQGERDQGLFGDIKELAGSVIDDPPDAASFHAHLALTQELPPNVDHPLANGPIVRLNPLVRPVRDSMGHWVAPILNQPTDRSQDLEDFKTLTKLDIDAVEQDEVDLICNLGAAWLAGRVRNQPIRWRTGEDVGCEIGHDSFGAGKARWLSL